MSNIKKGQTVTDGDWCKHLRPYGKRKFWKKQRRADAKRIRRIKNSSTRRQTNQTN